MMAAIQNRLASNAMVRAMDARLADLDRASFRMQWSAVDALIRRAVRPTFPARAHAASIRFRTVSTFWATIRPRDFKYTRFWDKNQRTIGAPFNHYLTSTLIFLYIFC